MCRRWDSHGDRYEETNIVLNDVVQSILYLDIPEEHSASIFEHEFVDHPKRKSNTDAAGYSQNFGECSPDFKALYPAALLFNQWYWYHWWYAEDRLFVGGIVWEL